MRNISDLLRWINHKFIDLRLKFGVKMLKNVEGIYQKEKANITIEIGILMKRRAYIKGILIDISNTKKLIIKELE